MNLENTKAFNHYVDEKFISKLNPRFSFSADEEEAESLTQNAICKFLINKIKSQNPSFKDTKNKFNTKAKAISADLSYYEAKEELEFLQKRLKEQYTLNFCLDEITKDYYDDIDLSSLLFFIYAKLLNSKNSAKYPYNATKYENNQIYQYLKSASLELSRKNIEKYFDYNLTELIDELLYRFTIFNYNNDPLSMHELFEIHHIDAEDAQVLFDLVNKSLNEKLIAEMHTLEDGRTF